MRTLFLEHLEQHLHYVINCAVTAVTENKEVIYLEQQIFLKQMNPEHIQTRIYQPRLGTTHKHTLTHKHTHLLMTLFISWAAASHTLCGPSLWGAPCCGGLMSDRASGATVLHQEKKLWLCCHGDKYGACSHDKKQQPVVSIYPWVGGDCLKYQFKSVSAGWTILAPPCRSVWTLTWNILRTATAVATWSSWDWERLEPVLRNTSAPLGKTWNGSLSQVSWGWTPDHTTHGCRFFSEGGNFAPQEVEVFQRRLTEEIKMLKSVSEENIYRELEEFQLTSFQQVSTRLTCWKMFCLFLFVEVRPETSRPEYTKGGRLFKVCVNGAQSIVHQVLTFDPAFKRDRRNISWHTAMTCSMCTHSPPGEGSGRVAAGEDPSTQVWGQIQGKGPENDEDNSTSPEDRGACQSVGQTVSQSVSHDWLTYWLTDCASIKQVDISNRQYSLIGRRLVSLKMMMADSQVQTSFILLFFHCLITIIIIMLRMLILFYYYYYYYHYQQWQQ